METLHVPNRVMWFSMWTRIWGCLRIAMWIWASCTCPASAVLASDEASAGPVTLYVSKLGDNSDGRSWATAFHTIQAALGAVPDANGGHRVVVRPDRYFEANLYPAHKGAPGAYNQLIGDFDGRLGSGSQGWVIIDSGDPEKGLKSVDWWGPWKCDPNFSGVVWDRWTFRRLYCCGSEGGIGWDMTSQEGTEFSAVVEDCVGTGRFTGGCVMAHVGRRDEPVVFRRCSLACLDWWGDAGAAYVRACHTQIPDYPDAVFEDCTLIAPDNALEVGYPGYDRYTRVRFTRCSLIVWNFSQPQGAPSGGIIHTPLDGRQLHVDLEDCVLMGYQVFGAGSGQIGYSLQGTVQAYVQYQQSVPDGVQRLARWPVSVFGSLQSPGLMTPAATSPAVSSCSPQRRGTTLYVSKLGDNSNGRSWPTAFHTIQAALLAVPDDQGGHQIVVRPDTYVEANLYPAQRGAAGSYNRLIGDFDGQFGSGAIGWVVIDSGDPQRRIQELRLVEHDSRLPARLVAGPPGADLLQSRLGPLEHRPGICDRQRRGAVLRSREATGSVFGCGRRLCGTGPGIRGRSGQLLVTRG